MIPKSLPNNLVCFVFQAEELFKETLQRMLDAGYEKVCYIYMLHLFSSSMLERLNDVKILQIYSYEALHSYVAGQTDPL